MPLGGQDATTIVAALDRHKKFLRGEIAQRVNLKFAPEIRFKLDESFENASDRRAAEFAESRRRISARGSAERRHGGA